MPTREFIAAEVAAHYVAPSWVAEHYGVSLLRVHRAIAAKRLKAIRLPGAPRSVVVIDSRDLPKEFPS